jgi:hypothetical protein
MVVARFSIATGVGVAMAVAAKNAETAAMLNFMMMIVVMNEYDTEMNVCAKKVRK